jgi:AcrR family transcriptional regulator
LTDRSIARERAAASAQAGAEEKRRRILDAAVRVFARAGFHASRVGDIAEEAGVAHGLLYHYFASKDEVLQTVFRENWGELLERFEQVEASDEPARREAARRSSRSCCARGGTTRPRHGDGARGRPQRAPREPGRGHRAGLRA